MSDASAPMNSGPSSSPAAWIGTLLVRVVVPLWILAGAAVKFNEWTTKHLPETIQEISNSISMSWTTMLAIAVAVEFAAVAIMIFVARLARPVAILMLLLFCGILIAEMVRGNFSSCGCFGANSPPPAIMLAIDGVLLLGCIFFRPKGITLGLKPGVQLAIALVLSLVAAGVTYNRMTTNRAKFEQADPPANVDDNDGDDDNGETPVVAPDQPDQPDETTDPVEPDVTPEVQSGPQPNANPMAMPEYWWVEKPETYNGQRWNELEIVRLMETWPSNMDNGVRYLVFYSRTCEHCEAMVKEFIAPNPGLAERVALIEIPVSVDELRNEDDAWDMVQTSAELHQLRLGDFVISPPLVIKVVDGVVTCVSEGEYEPCMQDE